MESKPNGNVTDYTYYLDQLFQKKITKKANGTLVNSHVLEYNANGHRVKDTLELVNANGTTVNSVLNYEYDARDRVVRYEKTGDNATVETYEMDLNGNVVKSTKDDKTNTYNYQKNRLISAELDGTTVNYEYDPYGRLHTVNAIAGGQTTQLHHYTYDGFDRTASHKKLKEGTASEYTTVKYGYDPLDRTITRTKNAGTSGEETTHLNYLGLTNNVLNEEVAGKITKSYTYSPWGERLSMVKNNEDGTSETSYYGYNPHTDVEMLFKEDGSTKATYGYTAYGKMDEEAYTFEEETDPDPNKPEPYNVYRYNGKRWDPHSQDYDMGFRNYSPGLNRFLTRDMYNGALANLRMSTDPFTMNRYAFANGNPVTNVEIDGHYVAAPEGYEGHLGLNAFSESSYDPIGDAVRAVGNAYEEKSEEIHTTLDVGGLAPVYGIAADLSNAGLYLLEGEWKNAGLSATSAVPILGQISTGARLGNKAKKLADVASKGAGDYGKVGGHHVHAKAAFKNHISYDSKKGYSISQDFMSSRGWVHQDMTNTQRQLFKELSESGRPNTIYEHNRIAVEALMSGGATKSEARNLVGRSLWNLRQQGVRMPTNIPWYK